jgi:lytic murein transglycosylase
MRLLSYAALAVAALAAPASQWSGGGAAHAQSGGLSQAGFEAYLWQLRSQARAQGVSQGTIDRIFPTLQFSSRTIELDRPQAAAPANSSPSIEPFEPYRARHLTPSLINRGRDRYMSNLSLLTDISRRFGVQPSVIIAIWGKETSYGTVTGDFDLLNSLASLAYEGRRRELFQEEFIATLKMIDRGIPRSMLKGSWAGATGYPQFLPSVWLRLGYDWNRDGRADIWSSQADALASIANYLSNAGWKPNVPWGVPAVVPGGFNRAAVATRLASPRCPRVYQRHSKWMSVGEWRRMGVTPLGGGLADTELASLLEPDGPGRTAYLLTTNYRSILDYNCSNFYALGVGLLADAVSR